MTSTMAMTETNSPSIVPIAREYQKGCSSGPSRRNGIKPNAVDRMVSRIGIMDCIDTKLYHAVNILDIPYVDIVKLLYLHHTKW